MDERRNGQITTTPDSREIASVKPPRLTARMHQVLEDFPGFESLSEIMAYSVVLTGRAHLAADYMGVCIGTFYTWDKVFKPQRPRENPALTLRRTDGVMAYLADPARAQDRSNKIHTTESDQKRRVAIQAYWDRTPAHLRTKTALIGIQTWQEKIAMALKQDLTGRIPKR